MVNRTYYRSIHQKPSNLLTMVSYGISLLETKLYTILTQWSKTFRYVPFFYLNTLGAWYLVIVLVVIGANAAINIYEIGY